MMDLSPDLWAAICQTPEVRKTYQHHGPDSLFTRNVAIFAIRQHGWPWLAALGATGPLTIAGGVGTLTIDATTTNWQPDAIAAPPPPNPAEPHLVTERQTICQTACNRQPAASCTIAGCQCSGAGDPSRRYSRCPVGKW